MSCSFAGYTFRVFRKKDNKPTAKDEEIPASHIAKAFLLLIITLAIGVILFVVIAIALAKLGPHPHSS